VGGGEAQDLVMKALRLTEQQWEKISAHLSQNYPNSVMLTRWKMRAVLGFTVRRHRVRDPRHQGMQPGWYHEWICLDFYDEAKKTMFLLKYSDWIKDEKHR
jgi:hypothetical protein